MKNNNKVKFNICNCHYALQKTQENGEIGFENPVAMPRSSFHCPGPNGEPESFLCGRHRVLHHSQQHGL